MTARFEIWERLLIRLSVRPSLRYSLLGSLLALTKGKTAKDEISCEALRLRNRKAPAPANTSAIHIAKLAIQRNLLLTGATTPVVGIWVAAELPVASVVAIPVVGTWVATGACSVAATTALTPRLESVSRFKRCKSARISAAI